MCGIFGIIVNKRNHLFTKKELKHLIKSLYLLSESRGREASGFACMTNQNIHVLKMPHSASSLIKTKKYKDVIDIIYDEVQKNISGIFAFFGHSRLVTHGDLDNSNNNHPVVVNDALAIHNGIIVNYESAWNDLIKTEKKYQIDTEFIPAYVSKLIREGFSIEKAVANLLRVIKGTASTAILTKFGQIALATNTGSLYYSTDTQSQTALFASEKYILKKIADTGKAKTLFRMKDIKQLRCGMAGFISFGACRRNQTIRFVDLDKNENFPNEKSTKELKVIDHSFSVKVTKNSRATFNIRNLNDTVRIPEDLRLPSSIFDKVKRCTKCILPETMPFISFDEKGVCNYCHDHTTMETLGRSALERHIEPYRKHNGDPDCLIGLSGGRDSSYALHYFKKELGMNPIAFTYDWGLVTDLARRNQARLCGKLGVEHIIVSADIKKKRSNIRKNINAWMKNPDLGIIPIFMAGDKHYYYHSKMLQKRTGVKLEIYAGNEYEQTNFKTGFCGFNRQREGGKSLFHFSIGDKLQLAMYYLRQFCKTPSYINSSIYDTAFAYYSRYFLKHNYLLIYNYIPWDEEKITKTLINRYGWETAEDTASTWRIGDGTTSFYNYIYFALAGLTENDTFRSKQIREGIITRSQAIELVRKENMPRYSSIKEYCALIDIDFLQFLKTVRNSFKIYRL